MKRCLVCSFVALLAACGGPSAKPADPIGNTGVGGGSGTGDPPAGEPVALPGACVDPAADAVTRLEGVLMDGDTPGEEAPFDLDGDGTADKVFTAGAGYTEGAAVYVMRGACGHFVGDLGAPVDRAAESRHHGLADIEASEVSSCEGAPCGCEPGIYRFHFDGTAYVFDEDTSSDSVETPCPDTP